MRTAGFCSAGSFAFDFVAAGSGSANRAAAAASFPFADKRICFAQKNFFAGKKSQLSCNSVSRILFFTSENMKIRRCGNPVNCLWRACMVLTKFSLATNVPFRQNPASRL
jgi:hypothetical protein